jgi:ribosomal protein S6--L-glutamate ligase
LPYDRLKCGWDDVGIDIMMHNGQPYVLEGNMKYGTKSFMQQGLIIKKYWLLILKGEL